MALPVADAVAAKVKGHLKSGDSWMNVLHYNRGAGAFTADATAIGADLVAAYTGLLPLQGDGFRLEQIEFVDLSVSPPVVILYEVSPDLVGSAVSDNLPCQIAAVVSWYTLLGGRAGRGRSYLPGFAEASNTLESGPTSGLMTALDTWAADVIAAGTGLVVVSYFAGHTWSAGPPYKKIPTQRVTPIVTDVLSGSPRGRWGTLRSRNNGK